MQGNSEEVVECELCKTKIISKVWNIHEIMCKKKLNKPPPTKKEPLIPCLQCGESFPFSVYAIHENECIGHQLTLCTGCGIRFPTFLFDEHLQVCEQKAEEEGQEVEEEEILEEGEEEVLNNLISTLANKEEESDVGLTQVQLANLPACVLVTAEECAICCTEMGKRQRVVKLHCKHIFHTRCVNAWLSKNPKCPMCRSHALKK